MIIKIDHLAFASRCMEEDLRTFRELGYEVEFAERNLQDLENKRPFMQHFSGQLDMALMTRQGSLSVEVLNHGHVVDEGSYIHPILEGVPHEVEGADDSLVVNGCSFVKVRSKELRAEFFVQERTVIPEFSCSKVIVDAYDIEQSAAFWKSVGFKPVSAGEQVIQLEFRSLLSGGTYLMYVRKKRGSAKRFSLDGHGFNCIAFISSDAERDRQRFEQLGLQPTEIERFRIGDKELLIHWIRGPGGEIVEVIGVA